MGGYLGTPQRTLTKQIGDVEFTIHRVADILNWRDPDVSFAYTFCGSMACFLDGKSDPAKETAERGRQKAQIEYHEPEWRGFYDQWAKSLRGLGSQEIDVWDYGDRVADVCVNGEIVGGGGLWSRSASMTYNINLSAEEIEITLKGALVGAQKTLRLGEDCLQWMKRQMHEIKSATRDVNRAMKNRALFLISPDDD